MSMPAGQLSEAPSKPAPGAQAADDILIELRDDLARRGNAVEQRLGRAAAALFLFQDGLAQVDAFAADIDVAGTFDQGADIAVALAAE